MLKAKAIKVVNNFSEYLLSSQPPVGPINDAEMGVYPEGI
jgi:hypothetical protein